jgi:hypothetical protein
MSGLQGLQEKAFGQSVRLLACSLKKDQFMYKELE